MRHVYGRRKKDGCTYPEAEIFHLMHGDDASFGKSVDIRGEVYALQPSKTC
jgi:hypothetical protein